MYHRKLFERGMSVRTVNNRHSNVKAFLKLLDYDIKRLPKPPKYDKTLPQIYSDQELKALFNSVTRIGDYTDKWTRFDDQWVLRRFCSECS